MKNYKSLINSIDKLFDYHARLLVLRADAFMDRKLIIPFYLRVKFMSIGKLKRTVRVCFLTGVEIYDSSIC